MRIRVLPLLLFIRLAWGQEDYYIKHIYEQDGVYKKMFSEEIVNGRIYDLNDDMDIEIPLGKIIDGLKEGFWTDWYKNGSIKSKINWKNGQISDIGYNYRWDGTLECLINYVDKYNYTKTFYDLNGNPDGTSMEYQSGRMYHGRETKSYFHFEGIPKYKPRIYNDPKIVYYDEGKLVKTEYISRKTGELVNVSTLWKINRAFQFTLTFISKQPKISSFVAKGCIGIMTIFSSQLI